jgi:hypothetical protein
VNPGSASLAGGRAIFGGLNYHCVHPRIFSHGDDVHPCTLIFEKNTKPFPFKRYSLSFFSSNHSENLGGGVQHLNQKICQFRFLRKDVVFHETIFKYPLRTFWVENPSCPC